MKNLSNWQLKTAWYSEQLILHQYSGREGLAMDITHDGGVHYLTSIDCGLTQFTIRQLEVVFSKKEPQTKFWQIMVQHLLGEL